MPKHYIVMADIVESQSHSGSGLLNSFNSLVERCNKEFGSKMLSPYTITLGDEFQGIVDSLKTAIETIFFLEEELLLERTYFQLRYVVVWGDIDTPVNPKIAHGMLGAGLATARELLTRKQRGRPRFQFSQNNYMDSELNMLFRLFELLTGRWSEKDHRLIRELLVDDKDESVAKKFNKNRSQIWKRRRSLSVEEYQIIKTLIYDRVAR